LGVGYTFDSDDRNLAAAGDFGDDGLWMFGEHL